MGVCASLDSCEAKEDPEVSKARSLGITPQYFGATTLEALCIETIRAEVERREKMPPMKIICRLINNGEEREIVVRAWEEMGNSAKRELGAIFGVTSLSFGNMDQELSVRWEELGMEEGATVSAVVNKVTRHREGHRTIMWTLWAWLGGRAAALGHSLCLNYRV